MTQKVIIPSNLGSGFEVDVINQKINVDSRAFLIPKTFYQNDNVNRTFTTTLADGFITNPVTIRDTFECKYHYELPCRNDSESWGGGYTYVYVSINGGGYVFIGHTGYQNAMVYKARAIRTDVKTMIIPRGSYGIPSSGDYTIKIKLRHRSYNGNLFVNRARGTTASMFASYHEFQEIQKG